MKIAMSILPLLINVVSSFLLPSVGVAGSIVLDQENLSDITASFSVGLSEPAQTFTVGRSGLLSGIEVNIQRNGTEGNDLIVEVRDTSNGIPSPSTSQALVTAIVPKETIPNAFFSYVVVNFGSASFPVSQGDKLALVLRHLPGTGYLWDRGENYVDGESYVRNIRTLGNNAPWEVLGNNDDFVFRTFVEVPEPSSIVLLSIAAATPLGFIRAGQLSAI